MVPYLKKYEGCFTFKSNLSIKNLNVYFDKKKLISNCIIFETNKYIYRNRYQRCC